MCALIAVHVAWCVLWKQYGTSLTMYAELCSGCDFCVQICPWDCLEIIDPVSNEHADSFFGICELVKPRDCVGCLLCEEVCIKDAIRVESPILLELAEAAD